MTLDCVGGHLNVRLFTGRDPTRKNLVGQTGSGQEGVFMTRPPQNLAGRAGSSQEVFETSRVGSGRIGFGGEGNLTGRVGSGYEDPTRPARRGATREKS